MEVEKILPPSDCNLPREKVFSIQIGTKLFRLSGASIASDGYHCHPKDGAEFVKLFADSQFYSLPRLMSQLFESQIIIQIGDRHFQISRDIFSGPGDSPNFFSLGFGAFFASPAEVFPGLDRRGLLRPPAIVPPSVPNRSGDVFAQLVHLLRGYPLHIESEAQRAELLRDCRYFHLRGLEQKLVPHNISFNPIRGRSEITLRLEDVRRSGIKVETPKENSEGVAVTYSRPFVDESSHDLVFEIGDENTIIDPLTMRPKFLNSAQARVASLLQVIVDRKNDNSQKLVKSAEHPLHVQISDETDLMIDGEQQENFHIPGLPSDEPQAKRRRVEGQAGSQAESSGSWVVRNGQWRILMRPGEGSDGSVSFVLVGVKLDVYTSQRARNRKRAFLGP
ncbi:hypothetical protein ASPVEDRAFT_58616 [Aspergillus versicolor CBS 583.65]|uniref:Potassium channel tetramerisation-type BTB domain-containing protein n=1 Tax=Aspergillus versicolor CBS 583.65 TaxID=1036611 RepID=A0A1L9P5P4_ASPVE|nr:uncharacterized protein ASPVEDRAFT_58616 [Aspergillus versicolor CBS 583.65]OJI96764.1 hypothetical protein ASPVEDRAFT_58616 [Aspergillus versicolor CBS 583.65]